MYKDKTILAVIPARGGSKGIKNKNIKILGGKPLIYYTIRSALKSKYIDRLVVSSDSQEIQDVSLSYGADVPFTRPQNLAQDDTLDLPVFKHALETLNANENFNSEVTLNLRPTNPFRLSDDIDSAIEYFFQVEADSVKTLSKVSQHPCRMWHLKEDGRIIALADTKERVILGSDNRRQDLPDVFWQNEYVDVCKSSNILEKNDMFGTNRYGFVIERDMAIDLNSEQDFKIAELLLSEGMIKI